MKKIILILVGLFIFNANASLCFNFLEEKEYTQNSYVIEGNIEKIKEEKLGYGIVKVLYKIIPTKYYNEKPNKELKLTKIYSEIDKNGGYEVYPNKKNKYLFFVNKEFGSVSLNNCNNRVINVKDINSNKEIKNYLSKL